MAARKPLVRIDGRTKELPAGDSIAFEDISGALPLPGSTRLDVTTAGTTAVPAGTTVVFVFLASPDAVTLNLPAVADQNGIPIKIIDWGGNATITVNADGAETFMGGASTATMNPVGQGIGGSKLEITPDTTLGGWYE